MNEVTLVR